jgi:hypothetical protein
MRAHVPGAMSAADLRDRSLVAREEPGVGGSVDAHGAAGAADAQQRADRGRRGPQARDALVAVHGELELEPVIAPVQRRELAARELAHLLGGLRPARGEVDADVVVVAGRAEPPRGPGLDADVVGGDPAA